MYQLKNKTCFSHEQMLNVCKKLKLEVNHSEGSKLWLYQRHDFKGNDTLQIIMYRFDLSSGIIGNLEGSITFFHCDNVIKREKMYIQSYEDMRRFITLALAKRAEFLL